ncbi:MAG: response regulator, partial [Verrucomicrobia bacterium]|nr:response regulator [Verrucomicrobiota bacterium]
MSRILVVDDEKDIVELVSLHLQREGHEVVSVGNGLAVLPMAVKTAPDLIVLDIMLPGIDGLSVLRHIRIEDEKLPILILSAKSEPEYRVKG